MLFLSLTFHVAIFLYLKSIKIKKPEAKETDKIILRISKKEAIKPSRLDRDKKPEKGEKIILEQKKRRTPMRSHQNQSASKAMKDVKRKSSKIVESYGDLLPGGKFKLSVDPSTTELGGKDSPSLPYKGEYRGEIKASGNDIYAYFDLPLVLRRGLFEGQAKAVFVTHEDKIILERLTGTPIVRAALWEALQAKGVSVKLKDLFVLYKAHEIKVTTIYKTKFEPFRDGEFETKVKVFDNEIKVQVTRYLGTKKYGELTGLPLPDKHAKRAERHDRDHLWRLQRTEAYKRVLKNIIIQ